MEFKVSNRVRLLRLLLISHSAVIVLLQGGHGYSFCAPTLLLSLLPVGHSLSEGPVRSELKSKNAFSVEPWMFLHVSRRTLPFQCKMSVFHRMDSFHNP